MKKMTAVIIVFAMTLILTAGFNGCISDNAAAEKAAVCYVLANTANSQGLNLNSPMVQNTVYNTVKNYGCIAVVSADGVPEVVMARSFNIDEKYKSASGEKLDMDARSKTANLIAGMQSVVATDPEVDYLAALHLAVRCLASLDGYDSKSIVVIGTGLSTTGVLNFQNNLISADPAVIVELLREKDEIPVFSGMTVYFQQIGDVAAPQKPMTSVQKNRLRQIYSGIVEAGGGRFVYNDIIANPVNESVSYPPVSPVELPADTPIHFEPEILESGDAEDVLPEPIVLAEEQVTFIGNKSEYLYPDEALNILRPIADHLIANQIDILLCGTTAGDENSDFAKKLSKKRAETVKKTLVELGVLPDHIITVGLGSADPWHIYGAGYKSAAASHNRKVVLLDASSETAKKILAELNY